MSEPGESSDLSASEWAEVDAAQHILAADWAVTPSGELLHYLVLTPQQLLDLVDEGSATGDPSLRLACGQTTSRVSIPGMFTRMGAQRCSRCCAAVGCPPGKGSPKNDPACSPWLAEVIPSVSSPPGL